MNRKILPVTLALAAITGVSCVANRNDAPTLPAARAQEAAVPTAAGPTEFPTETNVLTRDPSTIVKRDGTYWVYGTGKGVEQFSSTDRKNWTKHGQVLAQAPAWVAQTSPKNTDNTVWAPDVHKIGDSYYLYFSYSEFGTNHSGIGVATSQTLAPDSWKDRGQVIASGSNTDFNTIDPCVFDDAQGQPWLVFGSYFSGIKLTKIDANNGKLAQPVKLYDVATRPKTPGNAIEASAITYHDGYYYLWVNWDSCCAGAKSQYNIRVGRSKTVTGPYLDKSGVSMLNGGGSLFLDATFDDGSGRPVSDEVGPGHVGILREGDDFWLSTHYEWARDKGGATTMNVQKLAWDADGWPRAVWNPGPYEIVSMLPSRGRLTARAKPNATATEINYDRNSPAQRWTLDYRGDGFYAITSASNGQALSVIGDSKAPGAKLELAKFAGRAGQLWLVRANADGSQTLLTKASGQTTALDVNGCNASDGSDVATWTSNGLACQKWALSVR